MPLAGTGCAAAASRSQQLNPTADSRTSTDIGLTAAPAAVKAAAFSKQMQQHRGVPGAVLQRAAYKDKLLASAAAAAEAELQPADRATSSVPSEAKCVMSSHKSTADTLVGGAGQPAVADTTTAVETLGASGAACAVAVPNIPPAVTLIAAAVSSQHPASIRQEVAVAAAPTPAARQQGVESRHSQQLQQVQEAASAAATSCRTHKQQCEPQIHDNKSMPSCDEPAVPVPAPAAANCGIVLRANMHAILGLLHSKQAAKAQAWSLSRCV